MPPVLPTLSILLPTVPSTCFPVSSTYSPPLSLSLPSDLHALGSLSSCFGLRVYSILLPHVDRRTSSILHAFGLLHAQVKASPRAIRLFIPPGLHVRSELPSRADFPPREASLMLFHMLAYVRTHMHAALCPSSTLLPLVFISVHALIVLHPSVCMHSRFHFCTCTTRLSLSVVCPRAALQLLVNSLRLGTVYPSPMKSRSRTRARMLSLVIVLSPVVFLRVHAGFPPGGHLLSFAGMPPRSCLYLHTGLSTSTGQLLPPDLSS
eukprot:4577167-Pleurochrysis_carterae.AAC.1